MSFTLAVFCWLFVLLGAGAATRALLGQVAGDERWAWFFWPGLACRRVLQVAAILLSGGAVTRVSLLDPPLQGVEQEPSPVPALPGLAVALAPLVGSLVLLAWWSALLGSPLAALGVPGGMNSLRGFAAGAAVLLVDAGEGLAGLDFSDPLSWLFLYGAVNLATLIVTEREDPLRAALGLLLLLLVLAVVERVQGGVDGWTWRLLGRGGWALLVQAVTLSLCVLALGGLLALAARLVRAMRG